MIYIEIRINSSDFFWSRSRLWVEIDTECATVWQFAIFKARFRYKGKFTFCHL